jgi:outer membrane protein OmpA-like peptidoglycan-associated protein
MNMKKMTITAAILLTVTLNSGVAKAEASKEENVGFLSGAIAGAAVGGPIGFIVGGVSGVLLGEQVEKANHLDAVQAELQSQLEEYKQVQAQLNTVKQQVTIAEGKIQTEAKWITEGLTLNMMFSTNSSSLSSNDESIIDRVSAVLREFPELKIRLDGYADPRGDEASNLQLSLSRTDAVTKAFQARGIHADRLTSLAHGESKTVATTGDIDSYAMERRVSINFLSGESTSVAQN